MVIRGSYKIHSKCVDDVEVVHLECDWEMGIKNIDGTD